MKSEQAVFPNPCLEEEEEEEEEEEAEEEEEKKRFFYNLSPGHEVLLGEWRYSCTHSSTLALDGCEWSASRPGRFTPPPPRGKSIWYPLDRRLGGRQNQSGRGGEEKNSPSPCRDSNPQSSSR
jgi:hypothetical protein